MKKLIIIFLLLVLFIPVITKAAGLVPCGRSVDDPETPNINESQPCTACDLLVLFQNVLKFALEIAFLIVVGFIIYGGFRWIFSSGNETNIKAGQQTITSALIGLIIILCAWLIINTVFWLVAKLGGQDYTGTWWHLECTEQSETINNNEGNNGNGGGDGGGNGGGGGGKTENWCSDNAGYACVEKMEGWGQWNPNCSGASGIMPEPYAHCPEGTICCVPADPSKIIAQPENPEPPNQGGPCPGGGLMKLCKNYGKCEPFNSCTLKQHTDKDGNIEAEFLAKYPKLMNCRLGDIMICPEGCVHECTTPADCNK